MIGKDKFVDSLTGDEGGCWQVITRSSTYLFDLDDMTIERLPGEHARPTVNDRRRPLRHIDRCQVGDTGYWTMHTDTWSPDVDYYWHQTSLIHSIQRINNDHD